MLSRNLARSLVISSLFAAVLLACSSDDETGSNPALDASADVSQDAVEPDAGSQADAAVPDASERDTGSDGADDVAPDGVPDGADDVAPDGVPDDGVPDGADDVAPDGVPDDGVPDAAESEAHIHFVGRHEQSQENVRFGWSGSGFVVRFSGTAAHVRMDDPSGFFTVVVDGVVQPPLETHPGEQDYTLATGLSDATHVVEMYRRPEGHFGPTIVADVTIEGQLLAPPAVTRRVEVIGDSITCGYGNLGSDQSCPFSADTEDHYQTYAAIASRTLGAELSTIAWSGKGVVHNFGGNTEEPMPAIYARTIPTEDGAWSFSWQPDAVVINLGTNDFSTDHDPEHTQFVSAYESFLETIRSNYPDAYIMCTVAPLLYGDDETKAIHYIKEAVNVRNEYGDTRVKWIDLRTSPSGLGCDWHPSVATHEKMAALLVTELKETLGW